MPQEGDIVRNKATGAMGVFRGGQVVPLQGAAQANPVIAPPDPYKQAGEQRAAAAAQRAANAEARAQTTFDERNAVIPTPGNTSLTGEDYLATLDPGIAGQVRALSEGRRAFPTGTALKDPKIQELIAATTQYDPTLDAANAATRVKTRSNFTSGKARQNITAINTALGHLGSLSEVADALDNSSFPLWNSIANAATQAVGDPRIGKFVITRDAVANELMRVFRQVGASTTEIEEWKNTISSSDSPEQLRAEISQATDLLNSRLLAMQDEYQAGMGSSADVYQFLSPHAREVMANLLPGSLPGDQPAAPALGGGGEPPAGPQGAPPNGPPPSAFDNGAPQQGVATGRTADVFDAETAGLLNALVQQGRPYAEAVAVAQERNYQPPSPAEYAAALQWQAKHPNSPYNAANPTRPEETTFNEQFSATPLGGYLGGARSGALAGFDDELAGVAGAVTGGGYTQSRDAFRGEQAAIAANQPGANLVGAITGGTLSALGGEAGLAARGMGAGLGRSMLADTAYGATTGAGSTDYGPDGQPANALQRLTGAAQGAVAGAGGSYVGNRAGNALAKFGRGVSDASVNTLRGEGVNALTVGQTFAKSGRTGKVIKGVEDRLAGLPVVGDMVNARRAEGVRQFNARAFDKALEPIGATVGDLTGEEAVQRAQQQVSDAFTTALAGKGAVPDQAFGRDLGQAVQGLRSIKRIGGEVTDEVATILQPYANEPMLSGEALDDISRSLRGVRTAYRNDPLANRVNRQIDRVERAVFDLFDRQASGTIPDYMAARQAYRRLSVLEDAVLKGKNTNGQFTPAQLGQADRTNAVRYGGKRSAASGGGVFHDYQRAAQNVLPNQVPDSGTAGRVLVPLALIGGGAGADQATGSGGTALTIGTILAALYSRTGQRLLTKPGRGMAQGATRRIVESPATRQALGAAGAAGAASAITDQR